MFIFLSMASDQIKTRLRGGRAEGELKGVVTESSASSTWEISGNILKKVMRHAHGAFILLAHSSLPEKRGWDGYSFAA